ncbi:CPXCG motif-containing cysteine-rich protein [Salinicola corii]|uniref:CPXCG motif-containing cysteine-rich protein n=1 Tax=Salinicola corii TaxID=2606937 RepID=A0A640WHN6_9GAMM|nr:CPXCG motif-containing cysteine-rich protein [Salinicola corii]KAA0019867.1 CPXCG motif-containing cysteine-rich protein [Salinicola corii]
MPQDSLIDWPVHCPYCDAPFSLLLDVSAGGYDTWEDCAICCQPIHVVVETTLSGELQGVTLASDDDVV